MKPRFKIGDYVVVKAIYRAAYVDGRRELQREERIMNGWLARGWIVGLVRRAEGKIINGRLLVTSTRLLWKIALSLMNTPLEAHDADVELLAVAGGAVAPALGGGRLPLRLGAAWPRGPGGRWLPKAAQAGVP